MAKKPSALRQVELPSPLVSKRKPKGYQFRTGVAADTRVPATKFAAARVGLDSTFPPIIPRPIVLSNGGGAIASGNPVQLIFWGSAWDQASTSPSAATIVAAVQRILKSPYLSGLRQYGIGRCPFGGALVATSPDPPPSFDDGNVQDLIWALIDDSHFPEPDDPGGRNIYSVFMPPGTSYSPGGARGAHSVANDFDLPADVDHAWVAWIGTNTLDQTLSTFTHELVEICTDPEFDAWTVNGQPAGLNEIGDVCNLVDGPLNDLTVESYWSAYDNACLIPTAWSVRRTLAGAGRRLNGKGLLSLQNPIPSVNQFLVNL
jgi:hypothetical protein